jgi:hypothetical protein
MSILLRLNFGAWIKGRVSRQKPVSCLNKHAADSTKIIRGIRGARGGMRVLRPVGFAISLEAVPLADAGLSVEMVDKLCYM